MPRAGIMTFLHNDNYGSILQAYALQQVLARFHLEAEHIDYQPGRMEKLRNLLKCGNSPLLMADGLRKRSESGAAARSREMAAFRARCMKLSAPCRNEADLSKAAEEYDLLIAGSDQIWSPVWLNPVYFLNYAHSMPKISYACSLGIQNMPSRRKAEVMRQALKDFQSISVREDEGADIIEQITGNRPAVLPDPVLLLTAQEWKEIAVDTSLGDGRIVCYMIGKNPVYWDRVRRTAELLELNPLIIPMTDESRDQGMEVVEHVSPEMFLGLLASASYVMTDSFHGTMFATVFARQHTVLRRYADDDRESKNSRIDQVKRTLGYISLDACRPDSRTAQIIADLRQKGLDWLEVAFSLAGV